MTSDTNGYTNYVTSLIAEYAYGDGTEAPATAQGCRDDVEGMTAYYDENDIWLPWSWDDLDDVDWEQIAERGGNSGLEISFDF